MDPRAVRGPYQPAPRASDPFPAPTDAIRGATAAEMSQQRFGGPTRVQSTVVTATTTWAQLLQGNPKRVFWTVINRAIVNAAIDIDAASTYANGIPLGAAGGFASMDVQEDGESVSWPVFGASESSTATLRVLEVMRV